MLSKFNIITGGHFLPEYVIIKKLLYCELVKASSHTRLAAPEVVDQGLAESVLKLLVDQATRSV